MKRMGMVLIALAALLAACGDSDDTATTEAAADATEAPATTAAPTTEATPATTEAAVPEGAVEVTMMEWSVDAPTELQAGTIDFVVTNGGEFPHEFVIIRGDGYASLPTNELGTVQEAELEDGAFIVRVDAFGGGETNTVSVDLEAGNYVILCNIEFGPNSHAGNGQTLDVSVG